RVTPTRHLHPLPLPAALPIYIRRKRPPMFAFLLRISTLRRSARVLSLLALDFAGLALAIFTALLLKEAVHGRVDAANAVHGTERDRKSTRLNSSHGSISYAVF